VLARLWFLLLPACLPLKWVFLVTLLWPRALGLFASAALSAACGRLPYFCRRTICCRPAPPCRCRTCRAAMGLRAGGGRRQTFCCQ